MRPISDWIDFMEGEGTLKQLERMDLLLKHSIADQLVIDNLRRLRRVIKKSDPAKNVLEQMNQPEFFTNLHSKIMSEVMSNITKEVSIHQSEQMIAKENSLFAPVGQNSFLNSYKS